MKLLLTSTGLTNPKLVGKFLAMVGKPAANIHVAFIPTAANVSSVPDKRWMVDNIVRLNNLSIGTIDFVDISALPRELWLPRLQAADVLFVEGGTPSHLLAEMIKAGLPELFKNKLANKVYVGCSTGAGVLGEVIIKTAKDMPLGYEIIDCLKLVDFSIRPHYKYPDKSTFDDALLAKIANKTGSTIFAIDDDTAIAVINGEVEVVSAGQWKCFAKPEKE